MEERGRAEYSHTNEGRDPAVLFGAVVVVLVLAALAYFLYRQLTDPGYYIFPNNAVAREKQRKQKAARG